MPRSRNITSFEVGHRLSPESIEKLKSTLRDRFADGSKPACVGPWKPGQKEKMALTRRINSLGNRAWGGKYWTVMTIDGRRLEHRVIMEEKLGRKLLRSEFVHHKDEDKTNNHIDNLELMSQGQHSSLHRKKKPNPEFGHRLNRWSMKNDACIKCGTSEMEHYAGQMCRICFFAGRRKVRMMPNVLKHPRWAKSIEENAIVQPLSLRRKRAGHITSSC